MIRLATLEGVSFLGEDTPASSVTLSPLHAYGIAALVYLLLRRA